MDQALQQPMQLPTMSEPPMSMSRDSFSKLNIKDESDMPSLDAMYPPAAEPIIWTSYPPPGLIPADPQWYDGRVRSKIEQRNIWSVPTESGQIEQFQQLLYEFPKHGLHMMLGAAREGSPHIVRFLLSQGVQTMPDEGSRLQMYLPVHEAAELGHTECIKIFIEEGKVSPNLPDKDGCTLLMYACFGLQPETVRYLLEAGADISARQSRPMLPFKSDTLGLSALDYAALSGCFECAKLVLERAEQLSTDMAELVTPQAFMTAVLGGDFEMLARFLDIAGYPSIPKANLSGLKVVGDGTSPPIHLPLTDEMKDAIESTFVTTLAMGVPKISVQLLTYITSSRHPESTEYHWSEFK